MRNGRIRSPSRRPDAPGRDGGFTGLEAALVLIAFIIVAAVFSYTILNTGFFITQKSQNVIFSAVADTTSTLGIFSNVYGIGEEGDSSGIYKINFTCGISPAGTPVDFEKLVLTFSNASWLETLDRDPATYNPAGCTKNSGTWAIYQRANENTAGNNLLEPGEQFTVSACPSQAMIAGDTFTLEIKPAVGVALSISRTVPRVPKAVNSLH